MTERTYRDLCHQGTPDAVRRKYNVGDIFLNQAKCLKCNDVITSSHRHDFVWCSCKSLAVDEVVHTASESLTRLMNGKK